jgi:hypothetical protein
MVQGGTRGVIRTPFCEQRLQFLPEQPRLVVGIRIAFRPCVPPRVLTHHGSLQNQALRGRIQSPLVVVLRLMLVLGALIRLCYDSLNRDNNIRNFMTDTSDKIPANENRDPFLQADTALDELYRLRRDVLAIAADLYSFVQWKERERVLKRLDEAIHICLGKY